MHFTSYSSLYLDFLLCHLSLLATAHLLADTKVHIGYQHIDCHMISDVKMDFTQKAQFVAGGHMMEAPVLLTYSSMVSRDSVRIVFTVAVLNDLNVLVADIGHAYLNADCHEKVYTIAGPEFGSNAGKHIVITRALYGLKSSGAAYVESTFSKHNDRLELYTMSS